jgi:multiple sugar transport system permease protein
MKNNKIRHSILGSIGDSLIWIFLLGAAALVLIPLLFMFTSSIMPAKEIFKMPYPWITSTFQWENYWTALKGPEGDFMYLRNIFNSFLVSSVVTITTVILAALTGYGLAKFPFKGRTFVFLMIMSTMMIPFEAIMIPMYMVIVNMGLQDTYAGLILPFLTNAFGIFMMRQYLITFPDEILDAARIDGASELKIFWKVILPNSGPVIATLAILTFRAQWDNLLWPLLIAQSDKMKTIPLYITRFTAETHTDEGAMMAIAAIASIPMFILFFSISKYFVSGASLTSGSKG